MRRNREAKPKHCLTSGPLWRVETDARGKAVVRDDEGRLHSVHRRTWRQVVRDLLLRNSKGKADLAEKGDGSGSMFVVKGFGGWAALIDLAFGVVIVGGGLVFLGWMAMKSPQGAMFVGAGACFAFFSQFFGNWFERKRGNVQQRRLVYREAATKLLGGHCGVCDYDLSHAEEEGKRQGDEQAGEPIGGHAGMQLVRCPECSATWNLRGWRESYVLDDLPVAGAGSDQLARAKRQAMNHDAVVHGSMRRATRETEKVKRVWANRKRERLRGLHKEMWPAMKRSWVINVVGICGIAGTMVAMAWIHKMQAMPAGKPVGVLILPSVLVLKIVVMINIASAMESRSQSLEREALRRGLCAICEEALRSDVVLAHADNCVVCRACGARRDRGEVDG